MTGLAASSVGSTGEPFLPDRRGIGGLVRAARGAAAAGKALIAGTARESTRLTVEFTNRMADAGVDAALVRSPSYFKSRMPGSPQGRFPGRGRQGKGPGHRLQHPGQHRDLAR